MKYIILETHGGAEYTIVVMDEEGNNKVFDNLEEARKEAKECQNGLIVEINENNRTTEKTYFHQK